MDNKLCRITVNELLDALDGWGIVYEDDDLVIERLGYLGIALFDTLIIVKGDHKDE